ncbi:hypothetical protein GYMLUDRAFT_251224 [Collybiopsis luxurians FD-317 M1]|uniref:Uncharacterized protein n=1 Tax=Collybiopsis luxurians FD-317 M1 TaxID=944289 RepID=A0A0D0BRY8_9AGAR|nr:hypothetical protein GYMLUDRAFT_251224 [Collybiopsis luxurians FD-317 M1]
MTSKSAGATDPTSSSQDPGKYAPPSFEPWPKEDTVVNPNLFPPAAPYYSTTHMATGSRGPDFKDDQHEIATEKKSNPSRRPKPRPLTKNT